MLDHTECKQILRLGWIKTSTFNAYQIKVRKGILLKFLEIKI